MQLIPGEHPTFARDYKYKRHGTMSFMAAIDFVSGEVLGSVVDRHRSRKFVHFLQMLEVHYPADLRIQVILDNHSAHASKETRAYLQIVSLFVCPVKLAAGHNLVPSLVRSRSRSIQCLEAGIL